MIDVSGGPSRRARASGRRAAGGRSAAVPRDRQAAAPTLAPASERAPATASARRAARCWRRRRRASWRATSASNPRGARHRAGRARHPRRRARGPRRRGRVGARRRQRGRAPPPAVARGRRARPVPRRAQEDRREHATARSRRRRTSPTSRRSTAPSWWRCASAPTRALAEERGVKLSFLPFIIKATVRGAEEVPAAERHARRGGGRDRAAASATTSAWRRRPRTGSSCRWCATPTASRCSRSRARSTAGRGDRAGKAARDELTGSTFTITSLGALGGVLATPIINFPEVAILGVHKIPAGPAVVGDRNRHPRHDEPVDLARSPGGRRLRRGAVRGRIKAALETPAPLAPESG